MVSGQLSALLLDWTAAVTELNISAAHNLLEKEPELLWTPVPHTLDDLDHLENQLIGLNRLGSSFQPVSAIQFTCLYYQDVNNSTMESSRFKFLSYLIEQSTLHDLDTRFWGECNNSTLHLVCFLGQPQIVQLLIQKGVSVTPSNDVEYFPKDVTNSDLILNYLASAPPPPPAPTNKRLSRPVSRSISLNRKKTEATDISRSKSVVRPNYSTPDRFKLLRELAEESSVVGDDTKKTATVIGLDRKKSEGHFFKKGRVKETQQKVLTEEEVVELKKQKQKRQLEVAQLVKKSAVKNNPLFKKLEKRSYTSPSSPTPSPSTSSTTMAQGEGESAAAAAATAAAAAAAAVDMDDNELTTSADEPTPKRNSKVISSLKTKSYVSSSIFVQADEENPAPAPVVPTISLSTTSQKALVTQDYLSDSEAQGPTTILSNEPSDIEEDDYSNNYCTVSVQVNGQLKVVEADEEQRIHTSDDEDEEYYYETAADEESVESLGIASPISMTNQAIQQQHYEEEEEEEEEEESHVYPGIHNYYDLAIDTQNIAPASSSAIALNQVTSSDKDDEDDYSDEDEEEDDDDDYEEGTPVQFATRLTSPIYKTVVILNEDDSNKSNEKVVVKQEEVVEQDRGFESTIHEAFFGLDNVPKQQENNGLNNLYFSNFSKVSDDSGVEVEKYRKSIEEEEQEEEEGTSHEIKVLSPRTSSMAAATIQQFVEPSSSRPPVRPQRSDLRRSSSSSNNSPTNQYQEQAVEKTAAPFIDESKEKKRMSGSQKAAWTMSMSSWAAILDREFNLDEVDQENKLKQHKQEQAEKLSKEEEEQKKARQSTATIDYLGSGKLQIDDEMDFMHSNSDLADKMSTARAPSASMLSLASTLKFKDFDIPQIPPPLPTPKRSSSYQKAPITATPLPRPPQIGELPRLQSSKSISRKPIASSLSESNLTKKNISPSAPKQYNAPTNGSNHQPTINIRRNTQQGKLYLHVNGIQDILLPLPKDRAYVRCVVSDGRFEYMSRYEILQQNINFDYECVIDTHPEMIITISLHVRPDYVMKSKTPFSRLFSSKKKKESLSGYVNKEDGAIGQARFALAHMLPACTEQTYLAGFHCFNAWYSRSFKERHRQKKKNDPDQDVLKVVGNFDVEMLYLSMADYQKPFPRNLRECDMAIRQLHKSAQESSEKYHHTY